ncbi:MAG: hypothetical protein V3V14_02245 [Saprospiraceae bacterium]
MLSKYSKLTIVLCLILLAQLGNSQIFNSSVGVRVSPEKEVALSAIIPLNKRHVLAGSIGQFTPQPDFTIGASVAYHRHFLLNEQQTFQAYIGAGITGVTGDETSLGVNGDLGIMYIFKKIDIGLDAYPTYFFDDVLKFRPMFALHLRWVNR